MVYGWDDLYLTCKGCILVSDINCFTESMFFFLFSIRSVWVIDASHTIRVTTSIYCSFVEFSFYAMMCNCYSWERYGIIYIGAKEMGGSCVSRDDRIVDIRWLLGDYNLIGLHPVGVSSSVNKYEVYQCTASSRHSLHTRRK